MELARCPGRGLSKKPFAHYAERYVLEAWILKNARGFFRRRTVQTYHHIGGPSAIATILTFHYAILPKIGRDSLYFRIFFTQNRVDIINCDNGFYLVF